MSNGSIPAPLRQLLKAKLLTEGLITFQDAPHWLDSRVAYLRLAELLQNEFSGQLTTGGDYFGGEVVDSYFIYYEDNQCGLTHEDARREFRSINEARNA